MTNRLISDEQLLGQFVRGDQAALEALARRHELPLLGLARGLLGGREDQACDVVQEMWMRVIRFGASFNGKSSVKTWLYRILINRCREMQTTTAARTRNESKGHAFQAAPEPQPPDAAAAGDEREHLRSHVRALPHEQRMILLLCYHSGQTHESAAEILGLPLGTLKSRLHAALQTLRSRLSVQEVVR